MNSQGSPSETVAAGYVWRPDEPGAEDFTFTDGSPVDQQGYVVSEEEAAEGPKPREERRTGKPASGRSSRRNR
jgi:hypothetical protein